MKHFTRTISVVVMLVFMATGVQGSAPKGYYNSLYGKSGKALKDAVFALTRKHTVLSYSSLWYYYRSTDCYPDDKTRVWDMYSDIDYRFGSGTTSSTSGMNKEHSLPKSWWGGSTNTDLYPSYTDLTHLYPSDGTANQKKSNHPLGEVSSVSWSNGVTTIGSPKAGQGGGDVTVFEPDNRYKGDFARTYFYMACCYQDYVWVQTYMLNNNSDNWQTLNDWSIDLLVRWARQDPVSTKEIDRNDAVQHAQNNRNPFIDFPDLFEYIWGDKQGEVFNGGNDDPIDPTATPELVQPTQGTVLDFGEVALGRSIDYVVYVKGTNLKTDLSVRIYLGQSAMFSFDSDSHVVNTTIDRTMANSEAGYPLHVIYTPTDVGDHQCKLLFSDGGMTGSIGAVLQAHCVPAPVLEPVEVYAPEVDGGCYMASWKPADVDVDFYVINRTVYDKTDYSVVLSESVTTDDGETTSYTFDDLQSGQVHTYTVQASRLGYLSPESEVITIDGTGITGIEADRPLAFVVLDGVVLVKSSQPLGTTYIYSMSGQLVKQFANLQNDDMFSLPVGIYVVKTATSRRAIKLAVR